MFYTRPKFEFNSTLMEALLLIWGVHMTTEHTTIKLYPQAYDLKINELP